MLIVSQPFLLADHHRLTLLSNTTADEDQDKPQLIAPMTNVQSERLMRAEALSAFRSLANDDAEEEGKFEPKRREKDEEQVVADEEEYRSFLLEMGGGEEEVRRVLGMGDQPVPGRLPVAEHDLEEDQGDEVWSVRGAGRRAKKKSRKKAKEDDDFLMK